MREDDSLYSGGRCGTGEKWIDARNAKRDDINESKLIILSGVRAKKMSRMTPRSLL